MNKWITAAAAAGALSTAMPQEIQRFQASFTESPPWAGQGSERARIVGIASDVRRLVSRFTETDPAEVVAPRMLAELGVDGLARADVVLGLEARFDIDIDDAEAHAWQTVGDVVAFVARRVQKPRAA